MTLFKRLPLCLLLITSNVWAEELPRAAQRTENMAIAAGSASALTSAMYLGDPIMDYEDMVRRDTLFEDLHRPQRLRVSSRENLLGANMRLVYSNAAGDMKTREYWLNTPRDFEAFDQERIRLINSQTEHLVRFSYWNDPGTSTMRLRYDVVRNRMGWVLLVGGAVVGLLGANEKWDIVDLNELEIPFEDIQVDF